MKVEVFIMLIYTGINGESEDGYDALIHISINDIEFAISAVESRQSRHYFSVRPSPE